MLSRPDRIEGGVWGLLIGDALGVPYEFHPPEQIPAESEIELVPPPGFARAHLGTPPGCWSDDGAQAWCLLASLLERGRLDPDDLMARIVRWRFEGYMAIDGRVFDVGNQTTKAIAAFRSGVPALRAGGSAESGNGNGSLMRCLPLALWHRGSDAELVADARTQSLVTHGHLRAQLCCALYCLWARRIVEDIREPYTHAVATLRQLVAGEPLAQVELEQHIRPEDDTRAGGTGYVVDCLHSARHALRQDRYESVVRAAIRLGHDTDTTACVAGGLAGLRHGGADIPRRWRDGLLGQAMVAPLLEPLLARF